MAWKYDVSTRAFSLNGVNQFYAEYAGAQGYKMILLMSAERIRDHCRAEHTPSARLLPTALPELIP